MFNGVIVFSHTAHGWKVRTVRDFKGMDFGSQVMRLGQDLIVRGKFNKKPKPGFACRPHSYLAAPVAVKRRQGVWA